MQRGSSTTCGPLSIRWILRDPLVPRRIRSSGGTGRPYVKDEAAGSWDRTSAYVIVRAVPGYEKGSLFSERKCENSQDRGQTMGFVNEKKMINCAEGKGGRYRGPYLNIIQKLSNAPGSHLHGLGFAFGLMRSKSCFFTCRVCRPLL